MSPTIRHKYEYFHSTVQRAKDRRQKFHFCRLPFDVRPRNVKLNLSKFTQIFLIPFCGIIQFYSRCFFYFPNMISFHVDFLSSLLTPFSVSKIRLPQLAEQAQCLNYSSSFTCHFLCIVHVLKLKGGSKTLTCSKNSSWFVNGDRKRKYSQSRLKEV